MPGKIQILSKSLKSILVVAVILVALLVLLPSFNYYRMGMSTFEKGAADLISRSRAIRQKASPGYKAKILASRRQNPNNGAFFRLDDLLRTAVVRERPAQAQSSSNSGILAGLEFKDPGGPALQPVLHKSQVHIKDGVAVIEHIKTDYLSITLSADIPAMELEEIAVRARASKRSRMIIAWAYDTTSVPDNLLWENQASLDLVADGSFHTYLLNVKDLVRRRLKPHSKISRVLLNPSGTDNMLLEISSLSFISTRARYLRQINGTGYEVAGGEMRQCMYMITPQALEYTLRIPNDEPMLDFGTAILVEKEPITFEVAILDDNGSKKTVFTRTTSQADLWYDKTLDLSSWSGKNVRLIFRVTGSANNVALWSNPLLSSEPRKPFNVIVILEDALRSDHLSLNGYPLRTSPTKDQLVARSGVVFDRAISQSCKTRSSIPSLMTSLLPTVTGVWHYYEQLPEDFLTLAEIMRSQGFLTASFIQNSNAGSASGMHQGFSQLFDSETLGHDTEGILGDRLENWLDRNKERNFFLYLHTVDPHGPYNPPPPFDQWYRNDKSKGKPVKRTYLDPEMVKQPTQEGRKLLYDGEIAHNDAVLPKLLERINALGISQNTLLVLISDHGEHLGEHGLWDHGEPGYIQTIHVPIILVCPAKFKNSRRIPQTVQLLDVMPTILDLAQVDTHGFLMQGDSLVDLIAGRRLSYWNDRLLVSEEPDEMSTISKEPRLCGSLFYHQYHLLSSRSLFKGCSNIPAFLRLVVFNTLKDPAESAPVFSYFPDLYLKYRFSRTFEELQSSDIEAWKSWTRNTQNRIHRIDPQTQKNLKALGYVQ
jgi:arylsulfatase A-like enzyme